MKKNVLTEEKCIEGIKCGLAHVDKLKEELKELRNKHLSKEFSFEYLVETQAKMYSEALDKDCRAKLKELKDPFKKWEIIKKAVLESIEKNGVSF